MNVDRQSPHSKSDQQAGSKTRHIEHPTSMKVCEMNTVSRHSCNTLTSQQLQSLLWKQSQMQVWMEATGRQVPCQLGSNLWCRETVIAMEIVACKQAYSSVSVYSFLLAIKWPVCSMLIRTSLFWVHAGSVSTILCKVLLTKRSWCLQWMSLVAQTRVTNHNRGKMVPAAAKHWWCRYC